MIMYGRGERSIAEQLGCDIDEAREIKNNVYDAFPRIKAFERESAMMVKQYGYVTTLWGRKRRLPEYNLPPYEYHYINADGSINYDMKVPDSDVEKYNIKLSNIKYWKQKETFIQSLAEKEHIQVIDNNSAIANASRQIINSRVQGCLDGNTKIISEEYGATAIKNHVNETLTIWDGDEWTPGTIVESGKKRKCIIHLDNEKTFICSPDHKFRVTTVNGDKVWKRCTELLPGDNIDEDYLHEP